MQPIAVIMAGGRGERFWPASRFSRPKQFLRLSGDGQSLIRRAVRRLAPLVPPERVHVVTGAAYRRMVLEELPELPEENVLVEPMPRNTAACIGLAAVLIRRRLRPAAGEEPGEDPVLAVLPADHAIADEEGFRGVLQAAVRVAAEGPHLVTIGIEPDRPETGYGYLRVGRPAGESLGLPVYEVERFLEKPSREAAERMLAEGGYLWNSGMFVWRLSTILEAIGQHMPPLSAALERIEAALGTGEAEQVTAEAFEPLAPISIDYGVMEKASGIRVLPGSFGWDDVGSWPALERMVEADEAGNVVLADHIGVDTRGCIVVSEGGPAQGPAGSRLIATLGVEGLVIVDTPDALLICPKERAQEVREILKRARQTGRERHL